MSYFNLVFLVMLLYMSHFCNVLAVCPFILAGTKLQEKVPDENIPSDDAYNNALLSLDIRAVFDDIYDVMANSNECFPADEFNGVTSYAGLFLRNAWHCSGTFRVTDGSGGCTGGRSRYLPESNWEDNVNLDKARALLAPIKFKYGDALSWGDLFIFAGNAAILAGNGPIIEVCAGRIDDVDGTNSLPLDPEDGDVPCDENNEECQPPIGASTIELIYVNPQGVQANGIPELSAPRIREIFNRMGMNDLETVGLIGGGHAFGKCHGACPLGPGPDVEEQPRNPWPGNCGNNFPEDTFTSGIEGQWTLNPFNWDNQYFLLLNNSVDKYIKIRGPGGAIQFYNNEYNENRGLLMMVTDIAFTKDDIYREIVAKFAEDIQQLDFYFSTAWARLTTSGGRFASNKFCVSPDEIRPRRDESCDRSTRTPFIRRFLRFCEYFGTCSDSCRPNEFKFSAEYMCEDCQEVFGDSCVRCQDQMGCKECMDGYSLAQNSCGLWYCMPNTY